ncbi:MAG: hypothetical protein WD645_07230 [Dehalococcoidia bacterium]
MASERPKLKDIREQFDAAVRRVPQESAEGDPAERGPDTPYIHVAEYIPVHSWRRVLPFMRTSMDIFRFAQACPGFMAGGIRAKWWRRQFWSYTVWQDRDAMMRFVHNMPHSQAISMINDVAAPGACFTEWESTGPPDWSDAMERLKTPTRYLVPPGVR